MSVPLQAIQYQTMSVPVVNPSILNACSISSNKPPNEVVSKHIVYLVQVKPRWNIGLCDCCNNIDTCMLGLLCPCVLYGKLVNKEGDGKFCGSCMKYMFCASCSHPGTRRKLRNKYNLPSRPCNDCCTTFFCSQCALCQEYEESFSDHKYMMPEDQKIQI